VRTAADLAQCDGLIIPGGESTTMLKLLDQERATEPLRRFNEQKTDLRQLRRGDFVGPRSDASRAAQLGLMDIAVERNAYGRQIDSRIVRIPNAGGRRPGSRVYSGADHSAAESGQHVLAAYNGDPSVGGAGEQHVDDVSIPSFTGDCGVHRGSSTSSSLRAGAAKSFCTRRSVYDPVQNPFRATASIVMHRE